MAAHSPTARAAGIAGATAPITVPVTIVEGRIILSGNLINERGETSEIALQVVFDEPQSLTLHEDQYDWLQQGDVCRFMLESGAEIAFSSAEVRGEMRRDRQEAQASLTRVQSRQLHDHRLAGVLGLGFLKKYGVMLDLHAGLLQLFPSGRSPELRGEVIRPFRLQDGRLWIQMQYSEGRSGALLFGSEAYDSFVDRDLARSLGKPAGDVAPVWLSGPNVAGAVDLAREVAFRPAALAGDGDPGNDGAAFVSGVNLLAIFKVQIDWEQAKIAFSRIAPTHYPQEDFDFFVVEAGEGADRAEDYLKRYPATRLGAEAAQLLMQRRLQERASDEQLVQAMQWIIDTSPPQRRMENGLNQVRAFEALPGRPALTARAGALALQYSREASTAQDAYRLHAIVGEAYLQQGLLEDAWKHLLSAAFSPLDNRRMEDRLHNVAVNRGLAEVYEKQGRVVRAYSRYLKASALIAPLLEKAAEALRSPALPEAARAQMQAITQSAVAIDAALARLRRKIPAEDLEVLNG